MKFPTDGTYVRAVRYVARKEDFEKAITDLVHLSVLAVYPNGEVEPTRLTGFIQSVSKSCKGIATFHITTSETKFGTIEIVIN
jgi:hypothetical protein